MSSRTRPCSSRAAQPSSAVPADNGADTVVAHSPGVPSGNVIQVPVDVPVNVCGSSAVSLIGPLILKSAGSPPFSGTPGRLGPG
ncbi:MULTISPECIES: chaplin [unclassified Streptomyces]|uniref:chaplin n=1 Tax=unclassified Streptomyces TaxID=2593676 RepID=UPI00363EB784